MQVAEFKASCPYEVGDKIVFTDGKLAQITDIMVTYSYRDKKSEFRYELNGNGQYVRFAFQAGDNRD